MYAKEFLNTIQNNKKKNANAIIKDYSKNLAVGAFLGGSVGLVIALSKKKNLLMSVFIGSIIGASISKFINK